MDAKDRNFLARAESVTVNYQQRIAALQAEVELEQITYLLDGGISRMRNALDKMDRLEALQAEYTAHTECVTELREQHRKTQALNKLCADANKLAGTDGANFWTKAGKVFKEETPDADTKL